MQVAIEAVLARKGRKVGLAGIAAPNKQGHAACTLDPVGPSVR